MRTDKIFLTTLVALACTGTSLAAIPEGTAIGAGSLAIGGNSRGTVAGSIALGDNALAGNSAAIAIGQNSETKQQDSIVIGSGVKANAMGAIVIGKDSQATNALSANAIVIGTGAGTAVGGTTRDSIVIGAGAESAGNQAIAIGGYSPISMMGSEGPAKAAGAQSIALGVGASTESLAAAGVAVGRKARVEKYRGMALGDNAQALGADALALGTTSKAEQANAIAIGLNTESLGPSSFAAGNGAKARSGQSVALGNGAIAGQNLMTGGGADAVAIGNQTRALHDHSVSLGSGSIDSQVYVPVRSGTINGQTYQFAGANATGGVVSVGTGSAGNPMNTHAPQTRQIINVAPGEISATSTDAINGSQLFAVNEEIRRVASLTGVTGIDALNQRVDGVDQRISKLERQTHKGLASAIAIAGLRPLDFNPDDKWSFSAGYGNYESESALALGVFYQPNENLLLGLGSSLAGSDSKAFNASVSWKFGQNKVSTARVSMAKEIIDLRAQNNELQNQMDELRSVINGLLGIVDPNKKAYFPDIPENHWAYEYIATLAGNGIIEGYPDGTYKGDNQTTRYEMAAMVYRALEAGAPVDMTMRRALREFSPEIAEIQQSRLRVDRISGADLDRYKVERVRINNSKLDGLDIYGSVIR